MIKSTPVQRTPLLKSLLSERFPQSEFHYYRFSESNLKKLSQLKNFHPDGLIAELKNIKDSSLKAFDRLCKHFRDLHMIFILSPLSYSLLNQRRKKVLNASTVILSELKSLDYLAQLPRVIDDIGLRIRLQNENRELQELMDKSGLMPQAFAPSPPLSDQLPTRTIYRTRKENGSGSGIRVKIQKWPQIKRYLNQSAQAEFIDTLSRLIAGAVRSSDRVLRSKENEFLVFLSNMDAHHLGICTQRIEDSLTRVELKANQTELQIPFSIQALREIQFNS